MHVMANDSSGDMKLAATTVRGKGSHSRSIIVQRLKLLHKAQAPQPNMPQSTQLAVNAPRLHVTQT